MGGWRELVPAEALELPDPLREATEQRLRPASVVALDDPLSR